MLVQGIEIYNSCENINSSEFEKNSDYYVELYKIFLVFAGKHHYNVEYNQDECFMEGICHMEHTEAEQELQLVTFRLANEEYGLPITKVQEINRLVPVTKLPQTPSFMEGIINLRGRIIPVIDLRKRFTMTVTSHDDETRIIIVEISGQIVGVTVDAVKEVVRINMANIEPPPTTVAVDSQYINGVGKINDRLIILLDIDKVFTAQEELAVKQISG